MRFLSEGIEKWPTRLVLLALLIGLILAKGAYRRAAVQAIIAFPFADGLTNLLKHTYPNPRPCNVLEDIVSHGIGCSPSFGTASAHAANMAAVAFVFVFHLRKWGYPWVLIAFLVGISRIYVGAHFPSQVVLGWICGLLAGFFVTQGGERIRNRGSAVSSNEDHATA